MKRGKVIDDLFGKENGGWDLCGPGDVVGCKLLGAWGVDEPRLPQIYSGGVGKASSGKATASIDITVFYSSQKHIHLCSNCEEIMAYLSQRPIKRLLVANR
jgi:hypothetical protein